MDACGRLYYAAYVNNSTGGGHTVFNKKFLFTAVLAVAGYLGYKRVKAERAEQDLWAEATDPVQPRDLR
ncbi:MAG TPA: DLW-39 family protein [Jiangellaceae bacterium]